jgi:hypothetical protein
MLKRIVVASILLVIIGLFAYGDLVEDVEGLLPEACVTMSEVYDIFEQIVPCYEKDTSLSDDDCATIGAISSILYDALEPRPTFFEWMFGVTPSEKLAIAIRNGLMIVGSPDRVLTGREFTAVVIGMLHYMLSGIPLPCGQPESFRDQLWDWHSQIRLFVLRPELNALLPGLIPLPPTS